MLNNTGIYINHIGYLCNEKKTLIAKGKNIKSFIIQDMTLIGSQGFDRSENWKTIFKGKLKSVKYDFGEYSIGDFSDLNTPGIYRAVIPENNLNSFQFLISDGAFHSIIELFLDFIHNWRSGDFNNYFRAPSHLDDAVRSDTGEYIDVSGGWYDAGDLRKWMVHTNLPAIGFIDVYEKLNLKRNYFQNEGQTNNDYLTETAWALRFIHKMQDQETGMFFEDVGGGGYSRATEGMSWWYENHSGCLADNSDNRFTDNIINSGDERTVRVNYNPIVQYTNIYILLRAAKVFENNNLVKKCIKAAERSWRFIENKNVSGDEYHNWTSVLSWRLLASIELKNNLIIDNKIIENTILELLKNFDNMIGFWGMDNIRDDPYRGILHSAQPIIALCKYMEINPDSSYKNKILDVLNKVWEKYINNVVSTNPFGFIPYGTYFNKTNSIDHFRTLNNNLKYRFFMPANSPQKINHGLAGHWTSWAHALALLGKILKNKSIISASWNQLYWLWGANPFNTCLVSGIGYNNIMPHSRFLGKFAGGFYNGFIGNKKDQIYLDIEAEAQWNTSEYWNTPLANALMALAELLPEKIDEKFKIGKIMMKKEIN